ncbi:hypothetical protein UlMin_025330 [Ulmus minor]
MPESKAVVGLTWEPKLPNFSSATSNGSSFNTKSTGNGSEGSALWKPNTELVDGLLVPSNNPRKFNKLQRKQVKDTAGNNWFDMTTPTITPELQKDIQLLKLRNAMDPKRHYKKTELKSKYFQVGTVIESPLEFYSGRLKKKERKATFADELLSDHTLGNYRKRKVREIEEKNQPGGNEKWKIKGKHTQKRAKERRL